MRTFVIAALLNSGSAISLSKQWPSVARCGEGKTSTDFEACDYMNNTPMQHDAIPPSQHAQLMQRSRTNRDTFDSDPDTSGMYDDGWVYSKPGRFQAGNPNAGVTAKGNLPPKAEDKPMPANPAAEGGALGQIYRTKRDTFDNDPDTGSMYDDGWVYSQPGKFRGGNTMAGISRKRNEEWVDPKPFWLPEGADHSADVGALSQNYRFKKDTFDNDPDTGSMYDDGWVYSQPGKFRGGNTMAGISRKRNEEWVDPKPFWLPEGADHSADVGALIQRQSSWPSVARCGDGKTSTDFEACDYMNNTPMQHDAIPPSQHAQ